MRYLLPLSIMSAVLLAFIACDRGGGNDFTGLDGDPVSINMRAAPSGSRALQDVYISCNGEGCEHECGDENNDEPRYLEIIISVDDGDPRTVYNGPYEESVVLALPHGTVAICAIIYNCDCCVLYDGTYIITLPEDDPEVEITMYFLDPIYDTYYRDQDMDEAPREFSDRDACRDPGPGWLEEPVYGFGNLEYDCNDDDPTVGAHDLLYPDNDGDGFGDKWGNTEGNGCPSPGHVHDNTDCDDGNENINPDAEEIDGNCTDENCDGEYGGDPQC